MMISSSSLSRCAVASLLAVHLLTLAGCQSSTVGDLIQGGKAEPPRAVSPPPAPSEPAPDPEPTSAFVPAPPSLSPLASPPRLGTEPQPVPPWTPPAAVAAAPDQAPSFGGILRVTPGEAFPEPISPPRTEAVRVALLLPLTGGNAEIGAEMLNAAQLALFDFAGDNFELLLHDTQGTPEGAAGAVALAIGDGSRLILGPLLSASVSAAAPAARASNVNVIAFSSDRSVAGNGVHIMGFLPEAEVERVVAFAHSRGVMRFAALVPRDAYGNAVVRALDRASEKIGASVTSVQFYDPLADEFSEPIRELANYDRRRASLIAQRRALSDRDDEISRRALGRLKKLQTIGDLPFNALLVADGGKRLLALAALLPYYDIDPTRVRIRGTGRWEEPGLGAEPALLGGWFAAPPPAARADFEEQYARVYGHRPARLATLAYDATALAAILAQSAGGPDFSEAAITDAAGFDGRDGIFRFRLDGVAERGLAVLEVERRGFKVIGEAPQTFAVTGY